MDRVVCDRGVWVPAVALGARQLVRPLSWNVARIVMVAAVTLSVVAAPAAARAGWSAPVSISAPGNISYMQFATNVRGDAIAVWGRLTSAGGATSADTYAIEVTSRPAGGTWQPPVIVGTGHLPCDRGGCEHLPVVSVAIGLRGDAVVMWNSRGPGVQEAIEAASRTAGRSWQRPVVLGPGGLPQVALDQRGNAIAIWTGLHAVRVAFRPAGQAWQRPATIASGNGFGVHLALDARGDATAVWGKELFHPRRVPKFSVLVRSAFRPAGGSWHRAVTIGHGQDLSSYVELAVDPRGDTIAAWARHRGGNGCCLTAVQTAFKPAGGRWRRPVTLERDQDAQGVQVAFGRRGEATVVWCGSNGVRSASGPAGGPWGAAVTIGTPTVWCDSVRLGVDQSGDALAVWWNAPSTAPGDVEAAMASPQGTWQPPVSLGGGPSPSLTGARGETGAALDSHGNAVVVWLHDLGAGRQVVDAATFTRA